MIPELTTERLTLRIVTHADLDWVHALHSMPETDKYNTRGIPENIDDTRQAIDIWLADLDSDPVKGYAFMMCRKESGEPIGMVGLRFGRPKYKNAEVWYKLHASEWAKGYTTEAVKRVLTFGFTDLGLHRIESGCATENIGSVKVLEKAGMKMEGIRRKLLPLISGWADGVIFGILAEEWKDQ